MKKKSVLIIALALCGLASCRKQYVCNCSLTFTTYDNGKQYTSVYKNTASTYNEKMKEKQARAACDHEAAAMQSTFTGLFTNNGTMQQDPNISYNTVCTLKD
jgi:hypothetical protein